ncbi:hypothetical protein Esti_002657 [Eimeria stiedai]
MESSCVEKTTEKLCVLLESVDEELRLLTEELLPPLRHPASTAATAAATTAATAAATAAAAASDPAEARQQREDRRRELVEALRHEMLKLQTLKQQLAHEQARVYLRLAP